MGNFLKRLRTREVALYMVGRAGFEPATNWLKATRSSAHNTLFIITFSREPSPHFGQFQ